MTSYLHDLWIYFEAVFLPELATYETEVFAAAAITTFLAVVVVVWCFLGGRRRGKNVCLLGLSNSGKTLLFMRLIYRQFRLTQVSIKENKAPYTPAKKGGHVVTLVDIPGDERVRNALFSKYKDSLCAIVVVVDSENFPREVRNVAELLYDLLLERDVWRGRVPLLVACNKQDMPLARDCSAVRTELEKEITTLRVSRSGKLSAHEGKGHTTKSYIGKKEKDFEFSDVPCGVKFVGCSARGKGEEEEEGELENVSVWIDQHC